MSIGFECSSVKFFFLNFVHTVCGTTTVKMNYIHDAVLRIQKKLYHGFVSEYNSDVCEQIILYVTKKTTFKNMM